MIIKSQPQLLRKAERRLKTRLRKDFLQLGKLLQKRMEIEERWLTSDIETIILMSWTQSMERITNDLQNLYLLGSRYIKRFYKWDIDIEQVNVLAVKRVQDLKSLNVKNINGSMLNTTTTRVKDIIAMWIFEWKSYKEIWKQLYEQTEKGVLSPARAERIAINTIGNAYEQGRKDSIQQLVNRWYQASKEWSTVWDDRVTLECAENEAKWWIPYNAGRPSGDTEAPRASNPRCRCTTNYEIK